MNTLIKRLFVIVCLFSLSVISATASCGSGYTSASINWDNQYFSPLQPPASGMYYMFGTNSMRFSYHGNNTMNGVTDTHTGESGSNGSGNDLELTVGNGADTLVFTSEVQNLKFSIYDIDNRQRLTVTAKDANDNDVVITSISKVSGSSLTISGSGTYSAKANASSSAVANTSTNATANITIDGPVKTVILTFTKSSGQDSIFISDISACNSSDFPVDYQIVMTPETGEPSYLTAVYGNTIYAINTTTNVATALYTDPFLSQLNSLAFDPINGYYYYTDQNPIATNKSIYRYDVKNNKRTTWVADVTDLGIQLFTNGCGSGSASFYNGSYFMGIDQDGVVGSPEAIWRIDINPVNGKPIRASRFWGVNSKPSSTSGIKYDWADFVINDGILYDFNVGGTADPNTNVMHINLNTQNTDAGYTLSGLSQAAIGYDGTIYNMTNGNYSIYNGSGGLNPATSYSGTSGTILDASEAFKMPADHGDAPPCYGHVWHKYDYYHRLMLGSRIDFEMDDTTDTGADADDDYDTDSGNDEDGISSFPRMSEDMFTYTDTIQLTNITGANAYVYGWIDFNGDGDFDDAGEQSAQVVVASGATYAVVSWTGISGARAGNTYARFRIGSNPIQVQFPSGGADDGEVEDYPFTIFGSTLPVELVSFTAQKTDDNTSLLTWTTASEKNNDYFDVQRSADAITWESIGTVNGNGNSHQLVSYNFTDKNPLNGSDYYRLKQIDYNQAFKYSKIVHLEFSLQENKDLSLENKYQVYPNPAQNTLWVKANSTDDVSEQPIELINMMGETIYTSSLDNNTQNIDLSTYPKGMYLVRVGSEIYKVLKQ